jgi:hypothetical protein
MDLGFLLEFFEGIQHANAAGTTEIILELSITFDQKSIIAI